MRKEEIKDALKCMDVATARGRRIADKREIKVSPSDFEVANCADQRGRGYLEVAGTLRGVVERSPIGIPEDELESVEFIMEQLENLARRAQEVAIAKY